MLPISPNGIVNFAVQLRDAPTQFGADLYMRNVLYADRRAVTVDAERNRLDVFEGADIARRAHHVFGFGLFQQASADVVIAAFDGFLDSNIPGRASGPNRYRYRPRK